MSLAVRQGLFQKLSATKAITDLVDQRIFHEQAPSKADFPYIIFSKASGVKTRAFQNPEAFKREIWMVKAVVRDTTSNLADEVAGAIDAVLDGGTLTVSGKVVADLHHVGDVEYPEPDGDQQYRHSGGNYAVVLTAA